MSSLVSDFIINPVLRQARRLSEISRPAPAGDGSHAGPPAPAPAPAPPDAVGDSGDRKETAAETTSETAAETGPEAATETTIESLLQETMPRRTAPEDAATDDTASETARRQAALEAPSPSARPETPHSPSPSPSLHSSAEAPGTEDATAPDQPPPRDHLGFPLTPKRGRGLPEDDGMQELRVRIHAVNARDIPSTEKAKMMHEMLLEGYRASQAGARARLVPSIPETQEPAPEAYEQPAPAGPLESLLFWNGQSGDSASARLTVTESDIAPTYAPIRQPKTPGSQTPIQTATAPHDLTPPLGCQHYERNVKLQCSTCSKWYTCRFCHDAQEDHGLIRKETKNMLCMLCGTPQKASDVCIKCGETAARYYCNICKLWENRQTKPIYHCNDCGICRRGLGLGKDFFHCKVRASSHHPLLRRPERQSL